MIGRTGRIERPVSSPAAPPTSPSVLVIVPPVAGATAALASVRLIGGLPVLDRIVRAAAAAGYAHVACRDVDPGCPDPSGVGPARPLAALTLPPSGPARIVLLPANVVPLQSWLAAIERAPVESPTVCVDSSLTMVVTTTEVGVVLEAVRRCSTVEALADELRHAFPERPWPFDTQGRFSLLVAQDVPRAEAWLLRSLVKQREGFMSRHFERRVSLALTRRLAPHRVTPNAMTLVSAVIGLASAPFFVSSRPSWQLTGALLLLAHSILDGCDGELARLKFLQSRRGAVLDFWSDKLVHVAVFIGIAVGWSLAVRAAWPLGLGALAALGTLGAAGVMFERTAQDRPMANDSLTAGLLDGLTGRDFIYAIILLSVFGRATWFLAAVAVGTPVFLLAALWLEHRRGGAR